MKGQKFFQFLLVAGTLLCAVGIFFSFQRKNTLVSVYSTMVAQNTYLGPVRPIPGHPELVRVEVEVHDSPELGGVQIESAEFNGQSIPLKPRDIFGNRGKASFQVPPGQYSLKWVVRRDKVLWPRTLSHEESVTIDARDLWVQISIKGESASIL
jgi:hypothetical protein